MSSTMLSTDSLTLNITQEIHVRAGLAATFAALLTQLGPGNDTPDGRPMPMVIEAWPGGRWFRDLGDGNGHLWGHVQAIKAPTLLEVTGPLFMSAPVVFNVQYRLSQSADGTLITFRQTGFGLIDEAHRSGMATGWTHLHERVRHHAQSS